MLTYRHTTLGDRAFPVAAAQAWNALPVSVRTTEFIVFRQQTETALTGIFSDDRT